MATYKQKRALDELVEDGRNIGKALVRAGYSENTAKAPTKVTQSKGFIKLCEERGLTEKFLVDALVEDIEKKPQNRKAELELGFKVTGKLSDRNIEDNRTLVLINIPELSEKYAIKEDKNK